VPDDHRVSNMTIATGQAAELHYTGMLHECVVASVVESAQHTERIVEVLLALGFRAEIRSYRGRDTELWSLPASLCRGHGAAKPAELSQRTRRRDCQTAYQPVRVRVVEHAHRRTDHSARTVPNAGRPSMAWEAVAEPSAPPPP
jgi:hypothetical protein